MTPGRDGLADAGGDACAALPAAIVARENVSAATTLIRKGIRMQPEQHPGLRASPVAGAVCPIPLACCPKSLPDGAAPGPERRSRHGRTVSVMGTACRPGGAGRCSRRGRGHRPGRRQQPVRALGCCGGSGGRLADVSYQRLPFPAGGKPHPHIGLLGVDAFPSGAHLDDAAGELLRLFAATVLGLDSGIWLSTARCKSSSVSSSGCLAGEAGERLSTAPSAVAYWVAGGSPSGLTGAYIAEASVAARAYHAAHNWSAYPANGVPTLRAVA